MSEILKQKLSVPAWLLLALGVCELLLIMVDVHQLWTFSHPAQAWTLDSTTYYKFLEGQGRLNLRLYEQQQSHAARLDILDKKRQARPPEAKARSQIGELNLRNDQVRTYWALIHDWGYTYPDIAFAISAVETGYFMIKPGNNLFGMKRSSRHFYLTVSPTGYCYYASQTESLADYGAYEQQAIRKYSLASRSDYLSHIQRRFCPNRTYRAKLNLAFRELRKIA